MNRRRPRVTLAATVVCSLLVGCASKPEGSGDHLADAVTPGLTPETRLRAVDHAWEQAQAGELSPARVREEFKKDIFLMSTGDEVRLRMLEKLLSDRSPEGEADTRNFLRLRLPTERSWPIIEKVCAVSAERGWTDMTPALVRSYARKVKDPIDEQRPERAALLTLNPGKSIEEIVYDVFIGAASKLAANGAPAEKPVQPKVTPPGKDALPMGAGAGGRSLLVEKEQSDAWSLLVRLDKDGSHRAALLAADTRAAGAAAQDPVIADLRAAASDLKAVPATGPELEWVRMLRAPGNTANSSWWNAARTAIGRLSGDQLTGLEIRHAEPVRWAAANRPQWLTMNRDQLRAEADGRFRERSRHARGADMNDVSNEPPETILGHDAKLVWGDFLTMLVIDEALSDPRVRTAILEQANEDRANKATEYGGALEAVWPANNPAAPAPSATLDGAFDARLYLPIVPPRLLGPADTRFVASDQMLASTPRALAHYHFHVQNTNNSEYAGPSTGDMEHVASYARNSIVFTSISNGVLNVDYYQRNGVKIDLGELRR